MREDLKATLVELSNRRLIFFGIPEERALGRRVIGVRSEQRGGVRFNDAVEHEFHGAYVNPFVMIFLASFFDGRNILFAEFGRIQKICDVKANGELFGLPQFIEKSDLLKIATSAVDSRDAVLIGEMNAGAKSL